MDDERDALLVVRYAQAIGLVTIDAERLALEHAFQVHRVHVRNQHDLLAARALEHGLHRRAHLLGGVVQAVDIAGLQHIHRAAQLLELAGNALGNLVQTLDVLAARLDVHQVTQGVEQGLLLLLGQRMDIGHGRGLGHDGGKCQRQRGHQGADKRRD